MHFFSGPVLVSLSVVAMAHGGCDIKLRTDFQGGDLAEVRGGFDACCGICHAKPDCKGYAWNEQAGGTCYLKSDVSRPIANAYVKSANIVSFDQFKSAVTSCGYPSPSESQYNNAVIQIEKGGISTKREFAMFLAEILWESGGLVYKSEIRCQVTKCPNDYRTPGCDVPGQYYFGRGYIQLSWCYNYRPASADLFGDDRLVRNPGQVSTNDAIAWSTAFWFWKKYVHPNAAVQAGDFGAATNAINGALECRGAHQDIARKRFAVYEKVFKAFAVGGTPNPSGCY